MLKIESLEQPCKIIDVVLKTVKDVCPNIVVVESLINPLEVVRYHSSDLTFFRVKHLAVAVSFHKEAVKSVHEIKRLLQFEPYAGLDLNTLQCIHSDKNAMKDDKISNIFISHFVRPISDPNCILMYRRIMSQSQASNVNIQSVSPRQEVVQALETWRSETEGTYSCLRETLNKYSVFTGRNPLVSGIIVFIFILHYFVSCRTWRVWLTVRLISLYSQNLLLHMIQVCITSVTSLFITTCTCRRRLATTR